MSGTRRPHPFSRPHRFGRALGARPTKCWRAAPIALALSLLLVWGDRAQAQLAVDPEYEAVKEAAQIQERTGEIVPGDIALRDHTGAAVRLADYLDGRRPVILTLVYLDCPQMCGLVLDGLLDALRRQAWSLGDEYRVVTVSFDPSDLPEKAARWRDKYLTAYARPDASDWAFLTGSAPEVERLTSAVGFGYKWVEAKQDFAHQAALIILSPEGKITRYQHGIQYDPEQLQLSLMDAASGKVGTFLDQIRFLCYRWDPETGKYTATAMFILRVFAVVTVLGLALLIVLLRVREARARTPGSPASGAEGLIGTRT